MSFLTVLVGALVCQAATLRYHDRQTQYSLERTQNRLQFHSYDVNYSFEIRPCNMEILSRFWTEVTRAGVHLPLVKGSEPKSPHVVIDGQSRLLIPSPPASLRTVPQAVLLLKVEEIRRCGKP